MLTAKAPSSSLGLCTTPVISPDRLLQEGGGRKRKKKKEKINGGRRKKSKIKKEIEKNE